MSYRGAGPFFFVWTHSDWRASRRNFAPGRDSSTPSATADSAQNDGLSSNSKSKSKSKSPPLISKYCSETAGACRGGDSPDTDRSVCATSGRGRGKGRGRGRGRGIHTEGTEEAQRALKKISPGNACQRWHMLIWIGVYFWGDSSARMLPKGRVACITTGVWAGSLASQMAR